jgi:hypothetical protein
MAGIGRLGNCGRKAGKAAKKREKRFTPRNLCDYTCALFHGDIFRLGKPLQQGLHPPPWV